MIRFVKLTTFVTAIINITKQCEINYNLTR